MPYIGNNHIAGDHTNNFKVLDDISSFTATFNGSATSVVDTTNNTIRVVEHRFIQGQRVTYTNGSGGNIGGLTTGTAYFVIFDSASTIKLATSASNAASSTAINLSAVGTGSSHTLNVAFDGVNTKFKLTHSSGTGARLNNASQINIAINNVLQRPNLDPNNFTDGFALEDNHKIVFQTAPTSQDIFWGSIIANTLTTFDISDHKIDTFTGDGSTTEFTLSHTPANNESLMVTINGVLQHPSNASTARAYTLIASIIQFTAAPANGDEIQVRHLGFAGATTADVSGFYGRTGNVALTANDHITTGDITARNINASGILTASSANFSGNVSIGGTLTYEDVTNVDAVGLATFRDGLVVQTGAATTALIVEGNARVTGILTVGTGSITLNENANTINVGTALTLGHTQGLQFHTQNLHSAGFEVNQINVSGVATAATFKGDGDFVELDVDGHTNLDNVSVAGVSTFTGNAKFSSKLGVGVEPVEYLDIRTTGSATALVGSTNAGGAYFKLDGDSNGDGSGGDYARLVHDTDGRFYIDNLKSTADIVFRNGASATERLRITSDGKVGINRADPQHTLEVGGNVYITANTSTANQGAGLLFQAKTGGFNTTSNAAIKGLRVNDTSAYLVFETGGTTERLRIDSSGNIIFGVQDASTAVTSAAIKHFDLGRDYWNGTKGDYRALRLRIYDNGNIDDMYGLGVSSGQLEIQSQSSIGFYASGAGSGTGRRLERLRITSDGRLLIGETSVAGSAKLVVGNGGAENFEFTSGNSTYNGGLIEYIHRGDGNTRPDMNMYIAGAGAFKVYTNGANERLRINSSGNARIGGTSDTNDQGHRLTLQGSSNATYLQFFDNGTGTTHGSDGTFIGLINQDFYVWNREAKDVVFGSSNNERLRITSTGYVQTKSELWVGGSAPVLRWRDSTHGEKATARISGSDLYFEVANNERLRIASDGTLTLKNNSGMMIDLQSSAANGSVWMEFSDTDGTRKGYIGYGSGSNNTMYFVQQKANNMEFYSNNSTRFLIQSNGNKVVQNGRLNINSTFIDFSGSISTPATAAAIYRPADNTLAFSTANEERLRIDSSGRVVVGGTSAYIGGAALAVLGTGTTPNTYGSFAIGKIGANPTSSTTLANIRLNGGSAGTRRGAEINAVTNGNWTDGSSHPTNLTFAVAKSGSASVSQRLLINSHGHFQVTNENALPASGSPGTNGFKGLTQLGYAHWGQRQYYSGQRNLTHNQYFDLFSNNIAHDDIIFWLNIKGYHSNRTFATAHGTMGGYGLSVSYQSASGVYGAFSIVDIATGRRKLRWTSTTANSANWWIWGWFSGTQQSTTHTGWSAAQLH